MSHNATTVKKTRIIGTTTLVLSAWTPIAGPSDAHSTITTIDGQWHGRLGTEPLPAELAALKPLSEERSTRVRAWQRANYERAYEAIIAAHPEAAAGRRDMGEITLTVEE